MGETGNDLHAACRERIAGLETQFLERIAKREALVAQQQKRIAELEEQLARARKNSSTSSKPPSSDIVKPPKERPAEGQGKRKKGGPPGHPKHDRPPFPPDEVDQVHPPRTPWWPAPTVGASCSPVRPLPA